MWVCKKYSEAQRGNFSDNIWVYQILRHIFSWDWLTYQLVKQSSLGKRVMGQTVASSCPQDTNWSNNTLVFQEKTQKLLTGLIFFVKGVSLPKTARLTQGSEVCPCENDSSCSIRHFQEREAKCVISGRLYPIKRSEADLVEFGELALKKPLGGMTDRVIWGSARVARTDKRGVWWGIPGVRCTWTRQWNECLCNPEVASKFIETEPYMLVYTDKCVSIDIVDDNDYVCTPDPVKIAGDRKDPRIIFNLMDDLQALDMANTDKLPLYVSFQGQIPFYPSSGEIGCHLREMRVWCLQNLSICFSIHKTGHYSSMSQNSSESCSTQTQPS